MQYEKRKVVIKSTDGMKTSRLFLFDNLFIDISFLIFSPLSLSLPTFIALLLLNARVQSGYALK